MGPLDDEHPQQADQRNDWLDAIDAIRAQYRRLALGLIVTVAALIVAVVLGLLSLAGETSTADQAAGEAKRLAVRLDREGVARRDQTCALQETKQKADVDALARTYDYLAGLSRAERRERLNVVILAQLPRTVREAQIDDAPPFCDQPGVGLPEPDPKLPRRPPGLGK